MVIKYKRHQKTLCQCVFSKKGALCFRNPGANSYFMAIEFKKKEKFALVIVSNCKSKNRMEVINELQKHIPLDVFGKCGKPLPDCGRYDANRTKCTQKFGKQYKFYLAFENSNCRHYITEKFFTNALRYLYHYYKMMTLARDLVLYDCVLSVVA
jgi:glycosyl transferase family 10 (putative fucosyltransferase)